MRKNTTFTRLITPAIVASTTLIATSAYAAAPTAVPDARSIPENSSITINILSNDFDTDGDLIFVQSISQPANGTAVLNADGSVFYTANPGFGNATDTFTYVLADNSEEGLTSTGTVTITVQDNVYVDSATNDNDASVAEVLSGLCGDLSSLSDAELGAAQRLLLNQCITLDTIRANNPDDEAAIAEALSQIAPEEAIAQTRVALDANRSQVKTVSQRVQQQRVARRNGQTNSIALNGMQWQRDSIRGAGASADESSILSKFGIFASVQLEDAERDKTDLENGYDADSTVFTIGADYYLSESLLIGSTLGINRNELEYASSDGSLDTDITTLSVFGAYFQDNFSFYLQAGYGWTEFDSNRNVSYGTDTLGIDATLTSATKGTQQSINSRAEWEWQSGVLRVIPFARLDYLNNDTDAYGEQGTTGLEMSFDNQSASQLTLAAGVQSTYTLTPSWGVLVPSIGLTYLSEVDSNRDPIVARFAVDPDAARAYTLENDGGDTSFYQLSIGTSAVFVHGFSAFAEYTTYLGYENLSVSQLQLGMRYEL